MRLAPARFSLGWRPLLGLWLGIMCVAGLLQWLGPPSDPPALDVAKPTPPQTARPAEARLVAGTADPSAQAQPKRAEQLAAPGEPRSSAPVQPENMAPPSSAASTPAPSNSRAQSSAPVGDPPVAPAPQTSEREDTRAKARPLLVLHASQSPIAEAAAAQLAPLVGLAHDQVDARASADLPQRAVIRFYAPADHALARRIGQELARMGYSWRIENLSGRSQSKDQVPEVWLPDR